MQTEQQHIIALEKKIDELGKSVSEIRTALIGNDLSNKQGIVHDLTDHEHRIVALERKVDSAKYWLVGMGFGLGLAGYKIVSSLFERIN